MCTNQADPRLHIANDRQGIHIQGRRRQVNLLQGLPDQFCITLICGIEQDVPIAFARSSQVTATFPIPGKKGFHRL
tara:strand:- start:222 stop:449 length:228 start_codon:yes stop_codon:yes gene_type:complete